MALASLLTSQVSPPDLAPPSVPLRVVSFNIRYAATSLFPSEKPWSIRGPLLVEQLAEMADSAPLGAVVLLDMQEVLDEQLSDIKEWLGPQWEHIGVGRDDGARKGEYNPILYRPAQLRLLHNETRWLSPTPEKPSRGWGAGCRRVVTAAVFEVESEAQSSSPSQRFIAANTHLDHLSSEARSKSVGVLLETITALRTEWGPLPVSLTGDFNSSPGEEAYQALEGSGRLEELYHAAGPSRRFGPYETYTGFEPDDTPTRIDFIWLGPKLDKTWVADRYEVLSNIREGTYVSDHRPVVGDVRI